MSPRKKEQNEALREARRLQILEAALTVYVRLGYNGTDMDIVAAEAGLAKGLVYYYYKTKQELFRAMFQWALDKTMEISSKFLSNHENQPPIERLVHYTLDMFTLSTQDPRIIQFAMRLPFDAFAVFGPDNWHKGLTQSLQHQRSIAMIIQQGVEMGIIPPVEASHAANCFWTVFVANLFNFSKMIGSADKRGDKPNIEDTTSMARKISTFCFQGLGLGYETWGSYLEKVIRERSCSNEGI